MPRRNLGRAATMWACLCSAQLRHALALCHLFAENLKALFRVGIQSTK